MKNEIIAELWNAMTMAIENGDWKVDGRCDPVMIMDEAESELMRAGWTMNGIDGLMQNCA